MTWNMPERYVTAKCGCGAELKSRFYLPEERDQIVADFWRDHVCTLRGAKQEKAAS